MRLLLVNVAQYHVSFSSDKTRTGDSLTAVRWEDQGDEMQHFTDLSCLDCSWQGNLGGAELLLLTSKSDWIFQVGMSEYQYEYQYEYV